MTGAITEGTSHVFHAFRASDAEVTGDYSALDPLVARNGEATAPFFTPGVTPARRSSPTTS